MTPKLRATFQSPYDQYKNRIGQTFQVIRAITKPDKDHDKEVLPMYAIKFPDGKEIEAWPEEVYEQPKGGWNPNCHVPGSERIKS